MSRLRPALTALALFLIAFLPRLGALERYVTPDELHWVDRSIRFSQALSQGDFASTIQAGHPGVTTMWLGSLGLTVQRVFNPAAPVPGALPEFAPQNAEAMRYLAQFLTPMRWPVILVTSLNLVLLFWLLSRVVDRRAAFLAAALVALDPFAVALGGILHVDSLLMTFSLTSLAALSVGLNRPSPLRAAPGEGWLVLSGILAGLAMLSKSPAIVLVPTAGLVIALDTFHKRAPLGTVIRSSLIWGVSAAFIFIALYPAMWAAPLKALQRLTETAEKHSETAHAVNFFFGKSERDPGAAFYPVVLAFRSTPVLWLSLIAALILIARAQADHAQRLRNAMWPYWVFAVVFLGMVTLVAKKLDRYVLPTLEALNVIGALGVVFVIDLLAKHSERSRAAAKSKNAWSSITLALALGLTAAQFLNVWPLTLRAYNPLLGGYAGASAALPVGGGESAEVARQLTDPLIASRSIAATDIVGTAPFFAGTLWPATVEGFAKSDFLLFNASDVQLTPDVVQTWTAGAEPVKTLTVQGEPFAWLYHNRYLNIDRQHLTQQRQSGDALLVDYPAGLPGLLEDPTMVLRDELNQTQAIELIKQLAASHKRVFIYHFASQPDRNTLELFRALDAYAVNLDQWSSPLSQSALYALPDPSAFTTQPLPLNGEVTFGNRIHLSTIQTVLTRGQPGQSISFVSQWQATGADAQLSVSLLDDAGHAWSTSDTNVPLAAQANISRQRRFSLPVPLTIPPGSYHLIMNVIDLTSGSPLPVQSGGIDWPLGMITIDPAQTLIDPATRIPPITLNADLGGLIRFIGSEQPPRPIISGDPWTLSMEWAALTDHLPAFDVQWQIVKTDGTLAHSITLPLNSYSTDQWRRGDVLQSKYDFRLPAGLEPGQYQLDFLVLDRATHQPLELRPTRLTPIEIAARPRTFAAPSVTYPSNYRFDQLTTLIGANTDRVGNTVTVTLYWKADAITSTNYTVFVQLLRPDGQVAGQIDRWQIGGDAPTATWAVDQIIADAYAFDVPGGEYQVWVGVYNAADGQRLPAVDAQGQRVPQDKALVLTLK